MDVNNELKETKNIMNVPLADLKRQYLSIKDEIDSAIKNVIDNTTFINGPDVRDFEKEFAAYCGRKFSVGVSSGTEALRLALIASGIRAGDEVILPVNTFIATSEAVSTIGAKPVFVDVNEKTFNIDTEKIKTAITEKTKAILPVHLYGQCADMDEILDIAAENHLVVIEDCAQAHGSEYKHKKTPIDSIGCFSFFPGKNLGAFGDAGGIVTDEKDIAEKILLLRDHGRAHGEKYKHSHIGYNARLDTIQAAILRVKLRHLDEWNSARRHVAEVYRESLSGLDVPIEADYGKHTYHQFVVRTKARDKLQVYLKSNGISTGIHYPIPLHQQPAYAEEFSGQSFPIAEMLAKEIISLPIFPELSLEQLNYIIEKVNSFE